MTIGVQRIAENSSVVSEYSSHTAKQADQGNHILALVENISHFVEQLRDIVADLNKSVAYFKL